MAIILNSRRHLMVGATGALLLSMPAFADQRRQAAPSTKTKAAETVPVTASERLMRENGVLQRILLIYEAGARRVGQGEDIDPAVFSMAAHDRLWESGLERRRPRMIFQLFRKHLFFRCTRLFDRPIQRALLPDIEEAHQDQNDEQQHFDEGKHLQFTVHHRPWIKKNGLDVKKDEDDPH